MKPRFVILGCLTLLASCTGKSNQQNSESSAVEVENPILERQISENSSPTMDHPAEPVVSSKSLKNTIEKAVELCNLHEVIVRDDACDEEYGDKSQADQFALMDLDKDGIEEILLRVMARDGCGDWYTAYFAIFVNGSEGLKMVESYLTGGMGEGLVIFKNGMIMIDDESEPGTYKKTFFLLKNSNVESRYLYKEKEQESGDYVMEYYFSNGMDSFFSPITRSEYEEQNFPNSNDQNETYDMDSIPSWKNLKTL